MSHNTLSGKTNKKSPSPCGEGRGEVAYQEAIEYLFNAAPLFQNVGAGAYKEGLSNTLALDAHFGHPHRRFRTLHVAGTNGKGSVSHTLAAILQKSGLRVGLYTSPHLVDFRERIRIDGEMIPEQEVVRFVEEERAFFEPLHPSFFELATALAFRYFAEQRVDVAVVEVGLGGRLDCTNIITPLLSIITNISLDHVQFLGHTPQAIAREKAGIIKPGVPVVIGETQGQAGVRDVFAQRARELDAPIVFADEQDLPCYVTPQLQGDCQAKNTRTILAAVDLLRHYDLLTLSDEAVRQGFAHVCELTGLMGRWQRIELPTGHPLLTDGRAEQLAQVTIVCDTGHNVGGWQYLGPRLRQIATERTLHVVIGMVSDKDVSHVLDLLPACANYYFTQASVQRAMPVDDFAHLAAQHGLSGRSFPTVRSAFQAALATASPHDFIFVGGSTFIVADLLREIG